MVVKNTAEALAGSTFRRSRTIGTKVPEMPATIRLTSMATPITTPSIKSWNHRAEKAKAIAANPIPLNMPTNASRVMNCTALRARKSFIAKARTATARVCVPAFPPMDATMGISTASATTSWIVPWNREITIEARTAVARLTVSQINRLRAVCSEERLMSDSLPRPTSRIKSSSASSSIT